MEVDLHSSSFAGMLSFSASKRPRSPDDHALEHPKKRLSLAVANGHTISVVSPAVRFSPSNTPQSSLNSPRFPSEDWVRQTNGLSIDSPVMGDISELYLSSHGGTTPVNDENMMLDANETAAQSGHQQSLRPASSPQVPFTKTALFGRQQPTLLSNMITIPSDPAIDIFSSTPTICTESSTPTHVQHLQTRPPSPVDVIPMLILPESMIQVGGVGPLRRQRFTMGPRADCAKCQLGVKGHSVHY